MDTKLKYWISFCDIKIEWGGKEKHVILCSQGSPCLSVTSSSSMDNNACGLQEKALLDSAAALMNSLL